MPDRLSAWQFWIDRGGTFTDVIATGPEGSQRVLKLLSEDPGRYEDAALEAIRRVLSVPSGSPLPTERIAGVRMGTTVATNALLERRGARTALVTTRGFADVLAIGHQTRPDLFALHIQQPEGLYERVVEVSERLGPTGDVILALDVGAARSAFQKVKEAGITSVAIVLVHGYRYPAHERRLGLLACELGFTQVSLSSEVAPLIRMVGRGDTTCADAYLTPVLEAYTDRVAAALPGAPLLFMQSNGGLATPDRFRGRDAVLSGPAGGVVGAIEAAAQAGYTRVIGFDMGGTSTDVCHFAGRLERTHETVLSGIRLRAPMMRIHTIAAGGGSVLHFDGMRFTVGPDSAGAVPGPACYRRGGPLTITDCNLRLGRLVPAWFPRVFGPAGDAELDRDVVERAFDTLARDVSAAQGARWEPEAVAEGGLRVCVEAMARAIRRISVEQGHDITAPDYALCCFGGAAGQHACRVADALGMRTVLLHPCAGVLSAWGMGLAAERIIEEDSVDALLSDESVRRAAEQADALEARCLGRQPGTTRVERTCRLRYEGTDGSIEVPMDTVAAVEAAFLERHRARYGFAYPQRRLVLESIRVEGIADPGAPPASPSPPAAQEAAPATTTSLYTGGRWRDVPCWIRASLPARAVLDGPALIIEDTGTIVVEPGWRAQITERADLLLVRTGPSQRAAVDPGRPDPTLLTVFNHRFMSVAEQMGITLEQTSQSVNIKERRDYSCAVFDRAGRLVANAPHIPVHLGSMGESVRAVQARFSGDVRVGDAYLLNDPYDGGTHLPDLTVVSPVFEPNADEPDFWVAARGHHADVGGITPGSMPPDSTHIAQEGVLFSPTRIAREGSLDEVAITSRLTEAPYPARNPALNICDLKAQLAANRRGAEQLSELTREFGLGTVLAYMNHIHHNARDSVRRLIGRLRGGEFRCESDAGAVVQVRITPDPDSGRARVDFTGSSDQLATNANAPSAVCRSAVLYVFRALTGEDIPLNAGCLEPLDLIIPKGSMLAPVAPAAVVAGNVETSQLCCDALLGAVGALAGSQGTMNNVTFGNAEHQYYETLCGGTGAGPGFPGADAVHSHMTNSRLTDVEVLEQRHPVRVEHFGIRRGSGGAGRWRGGDGAIRVLRFLEPMSVAVLSDRRRIPPHGLAGGQPGACGRNQLVRADGRVEALGGRASLSVQAGDRLVIETPGGGGYGRWTEDS